MTKKRTGRRIVRQLTGEKQQRYRQALQEERIGIEANKTLGRELLRERRELSQTVSELKAVRDQLGIPLTELAERTGMTIGNLSRLEKMDGPNPTIETLRRYARQQSVLPTSSDCVCNTPSDGVLLRAVCNRRE